MRGRPQERASREAGLRIGAPIELRIPSGWEDGGPIHLRWLVADGTPIRRGQPVCEIELTKATAELTSPADGILGVDLPDGRIARAAVLGHVYAPDEAATGPGSERPRARSRRAADAAFRPWDLRKAAEIRALRDGLRGSLPSTVVREVRLGDLPARLLDEGATIGALVIFVIARALTRNPQLNASVVDGGVVLHERPRIGVAYDVEPYGLRVPVLVDADTKTLAQIAADLKVLLYKYMTKALGPKDLSGATFTLTDLTSFGVTSSAPLLVERQAAILALGLDDARSGAVLTLSLTFDHRAASGRQAALFLRDVASGLAEQVRGPGS